MLLSFDLFPERMLLLARFSGTYSTADGNELVEKFLNAPPDTASYRHFYDLTGVETFDADFGMISSMVSSKTNRFSDIPKGTACAILAPGDIAFGMARMYQSISEDVLPFEMTIFRTEAKALAALGQSETTIAALMQAEDRG